MDIQDAARVLIEALENDKELRNGMIASIASALKEYNLPFMPEEELAEHIINRIIGKE